MTREALRWCRVCEVHMHGGMEGAYQAQQGVILLDARLTDTQRKCVLAHEISHARHHDVQCSSDRWTERRADMEASTMLIDQYEYASLETICDDPVWIARELDVLPWVVMAYRECLEDNPGLIRGGASRCRKEVAHEIGDA